jgi:hypothetical protein
VLSHVDVASGKTQEVIVGPVEENGKDLPSGKNLGNYIDTKGRMDVLQFYKDNKKDYPICGSLSSERQRSMLLRWDVSSSLVS